MRTQVQSLAPLRGLRIQCCCEGLCSSSCCLDLVLLWLGCRLAVAAPILPVVKELPCGEGMALKRIKRKSTVLMSTVGLSIAIQKNMVTKNRSFRPLPPLWKGMYLDKEFVGVLFCFWECNCIKLNTHRVWFSLHPSHFHLKVSKLKVPHLPYFGKNKHLNLKHGSQT